MPASGASADAAAVLAALLAAGGVDEGGDRAGFTCAGCNGGAVFSARSGRWKCWSRCGREGDAADLAERLGILSAAPREGVAAERKLVFVTAREIGRSTPATPDYRVEPWLVAGAITELDGRIKLGKTEFALRMLAAALDGEGFLGYPTRKTAAVYLSEQPRASLRESLRRAGLLDREDFLVLAWTDALGTPWPEIVRLARAEAKRVGAGILGVDTLGQWAGLRGDDENSSGAAMAAIGPLQEAAADGLAVFLLRHDRKGGGEVGDSARGSSAFGGAVDIIIQIRRQEGQGRPSVRVLNAIGRFDGIPDQLVIELTEDGYVALGDAEAVAAMEARVAILDAAPATEAAAMKEADLLEAAGVKRTIGQGAIREHLASGALARTGGGKRGDPFRYWRPGEGDTVSAATTGAPAQSNGHHADAAELLSAAPPVGVPAESIPPTDTRQADDEAGLLSAGTHALWAAESNGGERPDPAHEAGWDKWTA